MTIPIPYVAPYLELGVGASIGGTTRTPSTDEKAVIAYHIPVGIGLSLGEHHNWDIGFAYLFHPSEKRFDGAIALGVSFQVGGPTVR